ncbi:MAG: hypothetical protein RLY31_984 [Bacteroidota bacterium]
MASEQMSKPLIIGITGGSGSGKTSLIKALRSQFPLEQVCIVSQDDFYKPREQQDVDAQGIRNFDRPDSIDKVAMVRDIMDLMQGKPVERMEYTFNNAEKKPAVIRLLPAPVIIVEGIFVFHYKKVRKLLDLKVFLHAKENLKVIRRIKRDQVERNYPLDDVLYRYENHVLPTFERYIQPYMDKADLIINNNRDFNMGLVVLSGFIRQHLTRETPSDVSPA